jgi:hypothetical protein
MPSRSPSVQKIPSKPCESPPFPRLVTSQSEVQTSNCEILFGACNGWPIALPPGEPDGVTRLSLEQACARWRATAEDLKQLYLTAFSWVSAWLENEASSHDVR